VWNEIIVKDWQHFNEITTKFSSKGWAFRGQRSKEWKLETSLYRECKNFTDKMNNEIGFSIERKMMQEFLSSYKLYSSHQIAEYPNSEDEKEWLEEKLSTLSIMQHYGTPTRLLDWTYSPYIATFFALDGAIDDFCIYALNTNAIEKFNEQKLGIKTIEKYKIFINTRKLKTFLYSYEPFEKNERLRKQQGLFLIPSVLDKNTDEILDIYGIKNGLLDGEEIALKLIFSKDNINEWWFRLIQMNITHETIYPGLEGFCKSLKLNIIK